MIDYTKAQTAISTLAHFFQALNDTNDALTEMGGLESKAGELTKTVADMQALANSVSDAYAKEIAQAQAELDTIKAEHKSIEDQITVASAELVGLKEAVVIATPVAPVVVPAPVEPVVVPVAPVTEAPAVA